MCSSDLNDRFRVGEVTRTDVSQAESRLSAAHADRTQAEGNLRAAQANYVTVVGHAPEKLTPPAKLEGYGYDPSKADRLPSDLGTAIDALEEDKDLADILGPAFVETFVAYKRNELERFNSWVTDWEFREYAYHL